MEGHQRGIIVAEFTEADKERLTQHGEDIATLKEWRSGVDEKLDDASDERKALGTLIDTNKGEIIAAINGGLHPAVAAAAADPVSTDGITIHAGGVEFTIGRKTVVAAIVVLLGLFGGNALTIIKSLSEMGQ